MLKDEDDAFPPIPSSSKLFELPRNDLQHLPRKTPSPRMSDMGLPASPPPNTLKKARKRLHGDPVTPTPQKANKRVRVAGRTRGFRSASPLSSSDASEGGDAGEVSYVVESPVKPSMNGKSYKQLFEEITPPVQNTQMSNSKIGQPKSRLTKKLERVHSGKQTACVDSLNWLSAARKKQDSGMDVVADVRQHAQEPPKDHVTNASTEASSLGLGRDIVGRKRTSSAGGLDDTTNGESLSELLLPPSPLPSKGALPRAPTAAQQRNKKARLQMQQAENEAVSSAEDEDYVQVIEESPRRRRQNHRDVGSDLVLDDELLAKEDGRLLSSEKRQPAFAASMNDNIDDGSQSDVIIEVDLPDDLQRILSIQSSRTNDYNERDLVEAVLQGGMPRAGVRGEVWGAGELEEASRNTDDEDDWAGEGVPWEVAEL